MAREYLEINVSANFSDKLFQIDYVVGDTR